MKDRLQPLASLDRRKVVHLLPISETAKNLILGHVQRLAILDRRHRAIAVVVVVLAKTPRPARLNALALPAALTLLTIRRDRHTRTHNTARRPRRRIHRPARREHPAERATVHARHTLIPPTRLHVGFHVADHRVIHALGQQPRRRPLQHPAELHHIPAMLRQRPRDDTVDPLRLRSRDRVRHERPDTALDAPLLLKERRTLLRPESQIRGQNLVHRGGQNVTVHARRERPHRPL